ncbi:MAG: ATP-binding cassette domain-containing protein [Rhodobiaceae bacterium]|jgi:tungstate transport system ATP-binding protein|nr:ATP-binding cassette domain-containing protein [Rhodobiaceae bacterium]MDB4831129.1 ATP-binding cassette domain-containing protein [Hyphomicrobiales bacterium]MDC3272075.1 ATP-binding cassette domain-containing protein [Hyphomicrobiales bacterium]|tara:strand:+ start:171 stop:914 length:744 start_codon:yes stop_codon:yes gene_type:complete
MNRNDENKFLTASQDIFPISMVNVTLNIDNKQLICNTNMSINNDGLTVLMGSNGSGKTLMLKLLHGLIIPSSGYILWNNQKLNHQIKLQQSMVFQTPVLLKRSVGDNISFVLNRKMRSNYQIDDILERVHLLEFKNRAARLLSSGEKQRLALGRALAIKPKLLFLDEPTSNLDPSTTKFVEDIIKEVSKNKTKVIFVTHDMHQAKRIADDIIFIDKGMVIEHTDSNDFFNLKNSVKAKSYLAGKIFL